ncbi:DUF262 domain-containing protein [Roseibium sp. RKSG952]|uniref:DUF262 domain-containing protein n=1 Tax=Roseibium sp. RKSG952 TaxID=2529384 RepID=UPI0012BC52CC|nr:DUF262 domain-containing protein [Roseibium sp. RKSG952]MTH95308.1 DUF262 domain-containing protein [Roseibium sp. RKSG952]
MTSRTTFGKLIERYGRVEIPIIQRDYAQGRADQHIVRDDFLKSLHDALCLPREDPTLPLDLDFVYGSIVNGSFQPLDGQQRLTTLFLLHWYLAWVDDCSEDFRNRIVTSRRSRFSYEVRPSSRDFINAFANYIPDISAVKCKDIAEMITDQPWYFRSWRFDPTIQAALSMLERMHEVFRKTSGLYARLIDETAPAITFQLLDLDQFDLSDDLYIKMNARGKPLTPFETFKARFEKHLEDQMKNPPPDLCNGTPLADFFSHRIDTRWSDFFWPFRCKKTATFDDAMMNLLRAVIIVTRDPEAPATSHDLADLRSMARVSGYTWFHDRGWLDQEMVLALITLLERWSAGPETFCCYLPDTRHLDEQVLFQDILTKPTSLTFQQLAQLAGYAQFLVHSPGEVDSTAFDAWMRVVSNLATNTDYNRPEDLRRSFAGLRELTLWMNDIVNHLASSDGVVRGFSREQVAEERIKAHLMGFGDGWPERLDRAERHTYFRGQIGFLLRCCGLKLGEVDAEFERLDATTASELVEPFEHYLACASQMFDDLLKHPKGSGRLWERALLAVGNFLPYVGRNRSLLTTSYDEAWGWKRLLRNAAADGRASQILKALWDQLEDPGSYAADLGGVIESATEIDPWREAILATPSVYDYGKYRMIRFSDDGGIYLLKKTQMNGRHAELFTYCLFETLASELEPYGFSVQYCEAKSTEKKPGICFTRDLSNFEIKFHLVLYEAPKKYQLYLEDSINVASGLRLRLEELGFEKDEDGFLTKIGGINKLRAKVVGLAKSLNEGD